MPHRCGQWACGQVCWNAQRGLCATCAPRLDLQIAGMQAAAQVNQLNQKIQSQDWTRDVNYRDQATGLCPSCGLQSGAGSSARAAGTRWPRHRRRRSSVAVLGGRGELAIGFRQLVSVHRPAVGTTPWRDHAAAPHIGEHESPGGSFGPGWRARWRPA